MTDYFAFTRSMAFKKHNMSTPNTLPQELIIGNTKHTSITRLIQHGVNS
jgi:hypothetical protein